MADAPGGRGWRRSCRLADRACRACLPDRRAGTFAFAFPFPRAPARTSNTAPANHRNTGQEIQSAVNSSRMYAPSFQKKWLKAETSGDPSVCPAKS